MKVLVKTLMFVLTFALFCSSVLLTALAAENQHAPHANAGQTASNSQNVDEGQAETQRRSYGTELRPRGHELGLNPSNAPALQSEVRIPPLEAAPPTLFSQHGITEVAPVTPISEPETLYNVHNPHTGYSSSPDGFLAAGALLVLAVLYAFKKPRLAQLAVDV